jgi:NAD(P)-dependent dehydrogenase (short-subunit alcohol dehydrogenase family)
LQNKVAVITGSTRGFGLAIARAYVQEGAAVVVCSRSEQAVQETVAELKGAGGQASGQACDVGVLAQVQALAQHAVETFGRLDVWVNNAGVSGVSGRTSEIAPEVFAGVLQTNVLGVYYGSWVALQHFLPRNSGKLINLQGMGDRRPSPHQNAYGSSKAWVRSFTQALAREHWDTGVGIFALNPGLMHTELVQRVEVVEGYERRLAPFKTVLRLWANPPELPAQKAVWLASAETDGRTGLEVKFLTPRRMLGGLLRDVWRRMTRRPAEEIELDVRTVPSVLPGPGAGSSGDPRT